MRYRTPFTLIELLVTISIIAILTSLLLPSLGKARKTVQQTACLSNHKQIGIGLLSYTNDYGEWWVYHPSGALLEIRILTGN